MRGPGRVPELLRQREFCRYWSAQTISMFGDQVSSVAIPYTGILALHADAAEMGFLTAAIWLPSLIFALHAGAWADRFGHRRILMITADLGRAGLLALIPVAALLHVLALWQLYAVAFAVGTLSVLFTVCDPALFVALVPSRRYVAGQSLVYGSRAFVRRRAQPGRHSRPVAHGAVRGGRRRAVLPGLRVLPEPDPPG
jgi:MFS family permease